MSRARGFAQAEREMRMLAELGCVAVAAPPFGNVAGVSLTTMAGHFAHLASWREGLASSRTLSFGVGHTTLSRLSEALYVAMESGVSNAKLLLDPFHMYTGGSELASLAYLNGANIGIVHVNDYPAAPAREQITDAERVFPGEGVAPTHAFARYSTAPATVAIFRLSCLLIPTMARMRWRSPGVGWPQCKRRIPLKADDGAKDCSGWDAADIGGK